MADFPGMMVPVGADDAALRRVLSQAESRVDQFAGRVDGTVRRAEGSFDRLGAAAGRVGGVLAGLAGLQILRGAAESLADATKAAMAFQTAMAQVGTLLKGGDTSRYAAQIKDLSRQFGQLPTEQAKGLYEIISAGAYSAANAVEVLTQANKLAIGGVTQVQTAADGLTSVLNSYGAAAGSAADVADAFFASAAAGKTNIEELSRYIGQVAPIAAQTGVSLDELLAAVAALTAGGIKTSTSMDGLRAVIAAVLKPTQEAGNTARMLGLEFNAAALKTKGLAGFLQDVTAKTGGSADALALLFGGVEALLPVMALASSGTTAFADAQAELQNKAGATDAAYRRIGETAEQTANRVRAAAEVYRVELGDRLLGVVQPAMAGLANNFDTLTGVAEKSALALGAVFAARGLSSGVSAGLGALTRAIDDQKTALYAKAVATAEAANAEKLAAVQDLIRTQQARALTAATVQAAEAEFAGKTAVAGTAASNLAAAEASLTQAKAKTSLTTNVYVLNRALAAEREAETAVVMAREASITADAEKIASLGRLRVAQAASVAGAEAVAAADAHLTAASVGAEAASVALAQRVSLLSVAWGGLKTAGAGVLAMVGGPWGAALLAGAATVALVASRTTEAEAATNAFTEAQAAARDAVKGAAPDVGALARQYAGLSDSMQAVTRLKLEEALAKQAEAIAAQRRAAASAVYSPDESPFRVVEGNHGSDTLAEVQAFERMGLAAQQVTALRTAFEAFRDAAKDDPEAIAALVQTVTGVGRAAGDAGKPLLDLARKLADPATKAEDAARTAKELAARLALLVNPSDEAARAVLGAGTNATTAASGFQAMGGEVSGLTAKLAELAAKAKLLEVPAGYQRRLAELVGPEPANGDARDLDLWRRKRDSADARLRPIVGLETRDQTAELERQATGQRLLAGAVTDAAKAQAQNRIELAKAALEYPGLGAETAKTLLTTKDFGAALKALPVDLQDRWAKLQASSQAQLAGAAAQGTLQLRLQTEAQARLAAAAGKGEAATRRTTIENQVAAAAVHGLEAATRANLEAQEKSAQQQIRKDADQPILAQIQNQKALVAAYQAGPKAVQAAEIAEKAHTLALKEGEEGTAKYAEAKAHYIGLLEAQARGEASVAAGPMLQQQRDQLDVGQRQLALMGASAEQRAVEMARTQALIDLRAKNIDATSTEGQTYLANAEALAKQNLEIERTSAAYEELERFGDRGFDALLTKLVQAGKSSMNWADALSAVGVELQQLAIKMLAINPIKNAVLGTNLPAAFDLLGGGGGGGTATATGAQSNPLGGLQSSATNWGLSKALGWATDKMFPSSGGLMGAVDAFGYNTLGIGTASYGPVLTGANGMLTGGGATSIAPTGITGGLSGYLGAAGAGAAGGMLGGYLGTLTNSKAVGGLSGAVLGGGASYLASAMGFGSIGGPVGIAIGAIVGGIMGMIGTQKKSVGPNGEAILAIGKNGFSSSRNLTDNEGDEAKTKQLADGAVSALNMLVTSIGGVAKFTSSGEFGSVRFMEQTGKYTSRVGGKDVEFSSGDEAMQDFIRRTLQQYSASGEISGVNADVKKALTTSKATKSEDLANDLTFAADFRKQFDAMRDNLNPVNNQLKEFADASKKLGEQVKTTITDWRSKASELGLATETELTEAARRGIVAMMGLGPATAPLVGVAAAVAQATTQFEAFKPALEGLGFTAAEVADLATRYVQKAVDAYTDAIGLLVRQGGAQVAGLTNSNARLSAADQFRAAGASRETVEASAFAGLTSRLDAMADRARTGALTIADLNEVVGAVSTGLVAGTLNADQYSLAIGMVTAAYQDSQARLSTLRQGWAQIAAITEPNRRQTAQEVLDNAMVNGGGDGVTAFRDRLQALFAALQGGTASASDLTSTYQQLVPLFQAGTITGEQFNTVVQSMTTHWNDARTAAAALASYQSDVNSRMYAAIGNSRSSQLIALDTQQAQALAEARAAGYDTSRLLLVQAAERAREAFDLAQADVVEAYDRQITAQQTVVQGLQDGAVALARIAQQFRDARAALRESDDSPLAPGVKRAEASARFEAAYTTLHTATATDADKESARQTLLQLGPTLVAMEKAASGGTASALFNRVDAVFAELGASSAQGVDTAEQQLQAAQSTLTELQRAREAASRIGERQLASLDSLRSVMDQSYAVWQQALGPLQRLTSTTPTAPHYAAPANVQAAWDRLSGDQHMGIARAMGWGGGLDEAFNIWLATDGGRASTFGDNVLSIASGERYGTPDDVQRAWNALNGDQQVAAVRTAGYDGGIDDGLNAWVKLGHQAAFEGAVRSMAHSAGIPGFQAGGIIGNGAWGRDSVLARFAGGGMVMLAGGEGVLTAGATAAIGADAVAYINRHHALPVNDLAPPSPTIAFRRPEVGGGTAGAAELLAAVEGLRADLRAVGRDALTQRGRIGADAAALLERVEAATLDLPRKLANTRRAA